MKKLLTILFALAAFISNAQWTKFEFQNNVNWWDVDSGQVYLPPSYSTGSLRYPAILFSPGQGEEGSLDKVVTAGLPQLISQGQIPHAGSTEFIVIVFKNNFTFDGHSDRAQYVLTSLFSKYRIDSSRVYTSGLSRGAQNAVAIAAEQPKRIAAVITYAFTGYVNTGDVDSVRLLGARGCKLWAMVGANDTQTPFPNGLGFTNTLVADYNTNSPSPAAVKTVLPGQGHSSGVWNTGADTAFRSNSSNQTGKNIYEWAIQYSLGGTSGGSSGIDTVAVSTIDTSRTAPIIGINEVFKTTLSVSWTYPSSATSFQTQRSTSRTFSSYTNIYSGTSQIVDEDSLTENTWYYYRVRALYHDTASKWVSDSVKTFWSPVATTLGDNRIATAADLSIDPFINVGDYLIVGNNSFPQYDPFNGGIGGNDGLLVPKMPHLYNKVCIIGGRGYDYIGLDMSLNPGTKDSMVVVTNIGGQVKGRLYIGNAHNVRITGKYDPVAKTGNINYKGFDNSDWSKLCGSFGFYVKANYDHPEIISSHVHGNTDSTIIEYIETGEGGYSGMTVKNDNGTVPMKHLIIRYCYTHDTGGESYYIGSTQVDPQMPVQDFEIYNNVMTRAGLNSLQIGQMVGRSNIHNNVFVAGGFEWNHSFQKEQDQAIQLHSRENGSIFRDNVMVGNWGQFINWFMSPSALEGDNPTIGQTTTFAHNLFTDNKSHSAGYITARKFFKGTVRVDSNYFGGFAKSNAPYRAVFLTDTGFQYGRLMLLENFDTAQMVWNADRNVIDNSAPHYPLALGGGGITNNGNLTDTYLTTPLRRPRFNNFMDLDSSYDLSSMEQWVGSQCPEWNLFNRGGLVWDSIRQANLSTSTSTITIPTTHPTTISAVVGTGKRYPIGERLFFITTDNQDSLLGTITDYNSSTGAVTISTTKNWKSGTFSNWNVQLDIESINVYRIYKKDDIVRHLGRFYKSLHDNNTNTPPAGNTDANWKLIIFSNGRTMPPDDVRMTADGFYAAQGIGLTNTIGNLVPPLLNRFRYKKGSRIRVKQSF